MTANDVVRGFVVTVCGLIASCTSCPTRLCVSCAALGPCSECGLHLCVECNTVRKCVSCNKNICSMATCVDKATKCGSCKKVWFCIKCKDLEHCWLCNVDFCRNHCRKSIVKFATYCRMCGVACYEECVCGEKVPPAKRTKRSPS
jgi:hypothetical protein